MSVCANLYDCRSGTDNSSFVCLYQEIVFDLIPAWIFGTNGGLPWLGAVLGSILVGLSGVLPLLVLPKLCVEGNASLMQEESANFLKTLLSFAVGGLLGDVFLHSLPEIWANDVNRNGGQPSMWTGIFILMGLMMFVITEKFFTILTNHGEAGDEALDEDRAHLNNNVLEKTETTNNKHITGYLNLIANALDNFTHGLSLGGAFLVSFRLGVFTTFAILVHEVPHEVGDFAILLKAGFSRWDAAKFQLITAGGGLVGSLSAIFLSGASNSLDARSSWILPFSAGTFLHIGLVTVLPDLLKEEDPRESFKQLSCLLLGILVMATVTTVFE